MGSDGLIRTLLSAWTGYPGRWLIGFALCIGLVIGGWNLRQNWLAEEMQLRLELAAQAQLATMDPDTISPARLIQHPRVAQAQVAYADGSYSPRARSPDSIPFWLPRRAWSVEHQGTIVEMVLIPVITSQAPVMLLGALMPPLLASLAFALVFAPLLSRPLRRLQSWVSSLDQGQLGQSPPHLPQPLAGLGAQLLILAERLRHTRSALQERQSSSDRQYLAEIRELKAALAKYEHEDQAQSALSDGRGDLLRTMSHEMRTPLTAIMGYADLLQRNDASPETGEYAGVISRSARNLLGMINNLLDLARIEAGALQPQITQFDITEIVEDTVALLAPLAFEKRLEINTLIYHDVPARLRGDPLRIAQVLTNLLSNAIKYTEQGEVIVRLLREKKDGDSLNLRLEVEDTGRGLDSEQQQKLFQAWRRFEVAGSSAGGSGLGLAIVHRLLDMLGGSIEVNSQPGSGSTFIAHLPVQLDRSSRANPSWDGLRGQRIWVSDNHPNSVKSLAHLLTFWDVDLRTWTHMADLHDALADPNTQCPAELLILGLDTQASNATIVGQILELPAQQRPPILVLTPSIDASEHARWQRRGADAVLAKGAPRATLYDQLVGLAQARSGAVPKPLAHTQVLVADNNRAGLRILQTQLHKLGAQVSCVETGHQALEVWQELKPSLVLLDYHMPEMNGLECAKALRASSNHPAMLIGMSAWLDTREEQAWKQAGIDAILLKPFDMDQLLRVTRHSRPASQQASSTQQPSSVRQLLDDPDMADLLREELPQQWQALDQAFIRGQLRDVRDAAHQLHGTAAFLHLQPLQGDLAVFERSLADSRNLDDRRLAEMMSRVQLSVRQLLDELGVAHKAE